MSSLAVISGVTAGALLLGRASCLVSRLVGAALVLGMAFAVAAPAFADQTILSADSAQVDCTASARDLTRISLVEDGFASVQKIATGNPQDDFSVVNEPLRGDIYLSVPDGFVRTALSFFATTRRGYVYKFVCKVAGDNAIQVFVSNPAIARERDAPPAFAIRQEPRDQAIGLVSAMYGGAIIEGYEMRQRALKPVMVGPLKVQLIAEYRGPELTGRVLRIENAGQAEARLSEEAVAPRDAVAVAIAEPLLAAGKATTAYLVTKGGR